MNNYVIAWPDFRSDPRIADVYGQLFDKNGAKLGNNFKINENESSVYHLNIKTAMNELGIFIIAWADYNNNQIDIFAQLFENDGAPIGANFRINNNIDKIQYFVDIKLKKIKFILHGRIVMEKEQDMIFGQIFMILIIQHL